MTHKSSEDVAKVVQTWIMHPGPPHILQADNGTEFKGAFLILLQSHGIKIINGRPRHPQSQGTIEQANGVLKEKIAAWKSDNESRSWVKLFRKSS
jgi:transposase InsO family protein